MLHVEMICVGKLKERFYADAAGEYEKRLSRYCRLSIQELPEEKAADDSPAGREEARRKEAREIESRLQGGPLVALCIEGEAYSSQELARYLQKMELAGHSRITFIIGGSEGLHDSLKDKANLKLSMSPMTFPHHLARVMILEQLYRAFKIREGSRYHK
ncbi:23S rRNA (pseudouridine(1915)-N(3))-methyltransferase RlmH [Papillibacter cinnamivorans]|uniref:Ribosomal RNA large subunit methyltransferase H n=1 Tax=Papillibacter cinnamivorans DSM 12816 TaxID=1122930 RepID=A0A1W2CPF8_9FIRM|nr:23S rRNA (pseudouridine(1915)-N(3))-methyltransferase RlmH [Papillibacter cinnamivorans]SMC86518.1 23S rRNA (pseudouridine1915-N3)-methyltransferase [Papillibacter cinnamivorans DSM 12816]